MQRTGTLRVLQLGPDPTTGDHRYALRYSPYDKGGGALPARIARGENDLKALLAELKIDDSTVRNIIGDVHRSGAAAIPSVVLTDDELRRHGLQEMGIVESVFSYLASG
jgi:hypothetical protein